MQKSVLFLYTKNELSEGKIKKTIFFTVASKNIKTSRNKFKQDVKDQNFIFFFNFILFLNFQNFKL